MEHLGIPIQILNGTEESIGFDGHDALEGFEDAIYKQLIATRKMISKQPESVASYQNPTQLLQMINYAIQHWDTPQRDKALAVLEQQEIKLIDEGNIQINGLGGLDGWFSRIRQSLKRHKKAQKWYRKKINHGGSSRIKNIKKSFLRRAFAKIKRLPRHTRSKSLHELRRAIRESRFSKSKRIQHCTY